MSKENTVNITLNAHDFIQDLLETYDIEVTLRTIDDVAELAYYYQKYTHGDSFRTGYFAATGKFESKYSVYGIKFEYDEYEDIVIATVYYHT